MDSTQQPPRLRRTVEVVCAVIERDGRLFAARRGPGMSNAGLWELPGGKVGEREREPDALAREIHEEFGATVTVEPVAMATHSHQYPHVTIRLTAYRCVLSGGELVCSEHSESRWLAPTEVSGVEWSPADVPLVDHWRARASG